MTEAEKLSKVMEVCEDLLTITRSYLRRKPVCEIMTWDKKRALREK